MSSVMPSLKYSCSGSPLMLANGSTQMLTCGCFVASPRRAFAAPAAGRRSALAQRAHEFRTAGCGCPRSSRPGRWRAGRGSRSAAWLLEAHRDQHATVGRIARLAAHPARFHRVRGPDHDQGPGGFQLARDQRVEFLARGDVGIPPHRPALRLQRRHQRRHPVAIVAGVGNEDVSQGSASRTDYAITRRAGPCHGPPVAALNPCRESRFPSRRASRHPISIQVNDPEKESGSRGGTRAWQRPD